MGPELSEEEKDKRTVFCMQLAQRVTGKDLEEFLISAGKVSYVRVMYTFRRYCIFAYIHAYVHICMSDNVCMHVCIHLFVSFLLFYI